SKDPSKRYLIILHRDYSSTLVDCHFQHHNLYMLDFL
ncbi:hypothetical protein PANDA_000820, partial [Ailuropoda melanoleuca]